jgi:hypothetical protein
MERKVLTASEGMLLTDGKEFGREILLGEHDSPDNWYEVAEDECLAAGWPSYGKAEEADYLTALGRLGVDV